MIKQDYILRIIEELSKVLAKIISLKNEGKIEESLNEIENYSSSVIGIKISLLENLSLQNIFEIFGKDQNVNIKFLLIAKLFKEKGIIISSSTPEESLKLYHKSLILYLKTMQKIKMDGELDLTQYYNDIFYLEKEIWPNLTEEEMYLLFKFYEELQRYEKAEDYLFLLKRKNYASILEEGKIFFEKLEYVDECILNRCGLSKEEIRESYEDFVKN